LRWSPAVVAKHISMRPATTRRRIAHLELVSHN
jgi:hypothetical protein